MNEVKLEPTNSKRELKKLIKYGLGAGAFMGAGLLITTYTQLLETISSSLKGINYILVRKSSSIQRGDIVSIQGHTVKYVGEKRIAKRVLGLPGDRLIQDEGQIVLIPLGFTSELLKYLVLQSKVSEVEVSEDLANEGIGDTEDTEDTDDYDDKNDEEEEEDNDDDKNTAPEGLSMEEPSAQGEGVVSIQEHTRKPARVDPEVLHLFSVHLSGIEIFPLLKQTREGNPLTPLSVKEFSEGSIPKGMIFRGAIPEGIIPPGYVFVAGDNPNSFDSHYEEFGLVPMEKIWGKAVLWW